MKPSKHSLPVVGPRRTYSRWRVTTLSGVYLLMGLHIAHWRLCGRTLAPLELNEVMYTLEAGIVTAGFLFMLVAALVTAIFGRFFCGWGCHILALQDLCAWLLERVRIRPRPVRSRVLLAVPMIAMLYMFVWPQVVRIAAGAAPPTVRVLSDKDGWASFVTSNFWRNLPGPGVALLTFGVCGFAIVYILGSRSFCQYACPYGAIFRGLDRLAPGRIVARGDCSQCGACTAVCSSHVRVHEELERYGTIVNSACLKDLDCVAVCPTGAVQYGFTAPPMARSFRRLPALLPPFEFSMSENVLMVLMLVGTLLIYRGLYDRVPFLLTLGMGGIFAYGAVLLVRLATHRDVRFNNFQLKRAGRIRAAGWTFTGIVGALAALSVHSAVIRYHEFVGHRQAEALIAASDRFSAEGGVHSGSRVDSDAPRPVDLATCEIAIGHLDWVQRWGLVESPRLTGRLARLLGIAGELHAGAGDLPAAAAALRRSIELGPAVAATRYNLGCLLAAMGQTGDALHEYTVTIAIDPRDADARNNTAFILMQGGRLDEAESLLREALAFYPEHAAVHFNLGRICAVRGDDAAASVHFREAARLDPQYRDYLAQQGVP